MVDGQKNMKKIWLDEWIEKLYEKQMDGWKKIYEKNGWLDG